MGVDSPPTPATLAGALQVTSSSLTALLRKVDDAATPGNRGLDRR